VLWDKFAQVTRDNVQHMRQTADDRAAKLKAMNAIEHMLSYAQIAVQLIFRSSCPHKTGYCCPDGWHVASTCILWLADSYCLRSSSEHFGHRQWR
jgi:hypothetical protein